MSLQFFPQVRDNVTGALARMMLVASPQQRAAFAGQFLKRLPLTEDHAEWRITLELIEMLVREGNDEVAAAIPGMIRILKILKTYKK